MNLREMQELLSNDQKTFEEKFLNKWEPRWPFPVYAIAGQYRIAKEWAMESGVPKDAFHYVGDLDHIRGARGQVVFLWEWWKLRDSDEIYECVNYRVAKGQLEIIDGGVKWGDTPRK